jgi:hypothetical protein
MSSFMAYRERSRDIQDGVERHVWSEQKYEDSAGSIIKVKGTDSQDEEAAVLNIGGVSFNLPKDSNTEVVLLSSSSDTNLKLAVLTIPKDKQRRWKEGTGGVQHPTDSEFALEFNGTRAHITQAKFAAGDKGQFEVKGDTIYIRGKLVVEGEVVSNTRLKSPTAIQGREDIPGFENPAAQL